MNLCHTEIVLVCFAVWLNLVCSEHPPAQQGCPEATRPHPARCDQYYRCALLPSKTAVWITTQCRKGLIYRHNLNSCVVPDNDWECDISMELERYHSEESVYGMDNPHQQAFPPSRTPPATNNQMRPSDATRTQYKLPSIGGDDRRGILIQMDQELNNRTGNRSNESLIEEQDVSQNDGSERVNDDTYATNALTDNATVVKSYLPHSFLRGAERDSLANNEQPPPKPLGQVFLSTPHLNSILGDYTIQSAGGSGGDGGQSHKAKLPLPPNGKIHPEHLTQIINQQKQLNRIATQMKQRVDSTGGASDFSTFTNNMIFPRKPILHDYLIDASHTMPFPQQHLHDYNGDKTSKAKGPYVSEDIIKSILQISQQMIANHHKTVPSAEAPRPEPEALPKPIFLPLSVATTSAAAPPSPVVEYGTPTTKPKITTTFSSKPIGISFTNPYSLSHTAVYDNLRNQPLNESMYYGSFQPTLYDIYGNRFIPKDPYVQMMPQSFPQYNPYIGTAPTASLLNRQPIPTYPSVVSPYVSPPQGPITGDASFLYSHLTNSPSILQLQNSLQDGYSVTSNAVNRFGPLDITASNESNDNDSTDSDQTFVSSETSDESSQSEADETQSLNLNPTYDQKLFAQGESVLDYTQYKDSIMPLLDANPGDIRISVASCTLGSREPNKTDCFKYFVCNPQNGAFQSFTCPSFTAFNKESRLCDTASYQSCKSQQTPTTTPHSVIRYKGSGAHSNAHLMQSDILTAQKYVELVRQEANKLLTRNNMPLPAEQIVVLPALDTANTVEYHTVKPSVKVRRKSSSKHALKITTPSTTTTTTTTTTIAPPTLKRSKSARKGPRCRAEGRIPNPLDHHSYYVCHRKSQKKFVKMKMTCPSGLKYCAASQYCSSHC
uniref:Chitin-binding type-2 domain-containing protein n=1 Tax=Anopheles epiroticus TaxID=199890 RepID=A0A182PME7_9DIPT